MRRLLPRLLSAYTRCQVQRTSNKKRMPLGPTQTVFRVYGTKRSRLSEESRVETARTRQLGACEACRKKKSRCEQAKEDFAPCGRCARTPMHLLQRPCCRVEIIDVQLFRLGTALDQFVTVKHWMQRKELRKDGKPVYEDPRRVQITHDVCTSSFPVTISRFRPSSDDTTAYRWTDSAGYEHKYELPPYYISDLDEAGQNLRKYIKNSRAEFTATLLVNANPIIKKTFKEAERYYATTKSEFVAGALMFWSAARMTERTWLITGDDMLGFPPMTAKIGPCRFNPHIEAIPVTPIMDTQLDEISIKHVLIPLKVKILRMLNEKILEKDKKNWYEIFLVAFIVLHSTEVILGQIMDYSRRYGISFAPRSNDDASLSHAYYHAGKTILAYFHFASGGATPLLGSWSDTSLDTSIMSQQQAAFLSDIQREILHQNENLQGLKNKSMYETEMFWCHQLLLSDWKADMPHSGMFLTCTEKDFLVS
ncbi:hypothetical protein BX600DRAFT_470302 [Xylariales sp. PMI_506]|nr:hypothetical protein BX600DRAFT_470302 [Xylariales sp. PMI_506]